MDLKCKECGSPLKRKRKSGMCKTCLVKTQFGPRNPNWGGNEISAEGLHMRVKAARGKANKYKCIDCGRPAKEWSQVHDSDKFDVSNYEPRCYGCHRKYDYELIHSEESRAKNSRSHKRPWTIEQHMAPRREGFKP